MFRTISDFISERKDENEFTIKLFSHIKDENLNTKVSENTRTLGRLAWHITQTLTEMNHKAGLLKEDTLDGEPIPPTMNEIIDLYKKHSSELTNTVKEVWGDEDLTKSIDLYGQTFEKRQVLSMLIKHQIHHRAQMTILMRIQGLKVPGIYGPSKEEWSAFGMGEQN